MVIDTSPEIAVPATHPGCCCPDIQLFWKANVLGLTCLCDEIALQAMIIPAALTSGTTQKYQILEEVYPDIPASLSHLLRGLKKPRSI